MSTDNPEEFIDNIRNMSYIIASHVRNNMENFHCEHLSDKQMAELNPIIRTAIFEMMLLLHLPPCEKRDKILNIVYLCIGHAWKDWENRDCSEAIKEILVENDIDLDLLYSN